MKTRLVFGSGSWRSSCWVSAVVLGGFLRNFCVVPAGFGVKSLVFVKNLVFLLKPGFLELRTRSHGQASGWSLRRPPFSASNPRPAQPAAPPPPAGLASVAGCHAHAISIRMRMQA